MTKTLILFTALFICQMLPAQDPNPLLRLQKTEKELVARFDSLYTLEDNPGRDSLNQAIINNFASILSGREGFYYRWNALPRVGKVYSEDDKLRVYTWYLQKSSGEYNYYGLLCYRQEGRRKKDPGSFVAMFLEDASDRIPEPEQATLNPGFWYGSVYYAIKTFTHRRNSWYALIGYDFNNPFSTKKLIEIVRVSKEGWVEFGGVFKANEQSKKRMIFEYSAEVAMFLNYDERMGKIVFDHLRPFEPILSGNYRFYGPDGSYDAFRFEKGIFILEEDVDARNE
jgi:hypothetical protein